MSANLTARSHTRTAGWVASGRGDTFTLPADLFQPPKYRVGLLEAPLAQGARRTTERNEVVPPWKRSLCSSGQDRNGTLSYRVLATALARVGVSLASRRENGSAATGPSPGPGRPPPSFKSASPPKSTASALAFRRRFVRSRRVVGDGLCVVPTGDSSYHDRGALPRRRGEGAACAEPVVIHDTRRNFFLY